MRHQYLYIGLAILPILWIRSEFGWLWIFCCMVYACKYLHKRIYILFMLVGFQLLGISSEPIMPKSTLIVEVEEIKSNYIIGKSEEQRVLLYQIGDVSFGDVLEVKGEPSPITTLHNFYQFDFSKWASKRGIFYGIQVDSYKIVKKSSSLRANLFNHIQAKEEATSSYLLSTLYGIQPEEELNYMVSSSGMHLSYIAHILQVLLSLCMPIPMASALSLGIIACIGSITVLKDSLLRILVFRIVSLLLPTYSSHDRLGISIVVLLALYPHMATELAFVLPVCFRFVHIFNIKKRSRYIVSFLVLVPIQFYYFQQVDILQILLFPFLRYAYALNYCIALVYVCIPISILYALAQFLLTSMHQLSQVSIRFYFGTNLLFCILWFYNAMHIVSRDHKKDRWILVTILLYSQFHPYLNPFLEVQMIDVGQGDSTLISLPFNRGNMLIDIAGNRNKNIPKDIIVPLLRAKGIRKIDVAIITHDDFDHSGGVDQFLELMPIAQIITEKREEVTLDDFRFYFLLSDMSYDDTNENSLITYLEAYDTRFLFMGDAGKHAEKQIERTYPDLRADIVKIGHHGSKTSSSISFIHQLHAEIGLISCGMNNMYGHPSPQTLNTLEKEGIYVLDTPNKGAISIKLSTFLRFYKTATNEFGIIQEGDN